MCGLLGGVSVQNNFFSDVKVRSALEKIGHRGPNDMGYELEKTKSGHELLLGHTRLSVIDLSKAGHQPMNSCDGRISVVFNGEIYNYKELRTELISLGYVFNTDSDTEVLINSWRAWEASSLEKFIGMFSICLYDRDLNEIHLIRDAFGIKPLFYSLLSDSFVFSSEIASLRALSGEKFILDEQKSYDYLVHGEYDDSEFTFIKGIKQVRPGSLITISLSDYREFNEVKWWAPNLETINSVSLDEAAAQVRDEFLNNVRLHLRSDVPIGAALSGGLDSTSIVCAIRHLEPNLNINTFSYIADGNMSEECWVDKANSFVKASGNKVYADEAGLFDNLDNLLKCQGEPFGSTSLYAQYKVFELAHNSGVVVTLDGQGADELLAGYNGYPMFRIKSLIEERRFFAAIIFMWKWSRWPGRSLSKGLGYLAQAMLPTSVFSAVKSFFFKENVPNWINSDYLVRSRVQTSSKTYSFSSKFVGRRVHERLLYAITQLGLPMLLRHGDRNSMAFSIESRVPFLTPQFAKLLLTLPEEYLISMDGETKHVFRKAMKGIVPDEMLERKDKVGFETPEARWLLSRQSDIKHLLEGCGDIEILDSVNVLSQFENFCNHKVNFSWKLWRIINFIYWHRSQCEAAI